MLIRGIQCRADNLQLSNFTKIKRKLQQSLPEELFLYPSGYTGQ
jgi:hypothetical protein